MRPVMRPGWSAVMSWRGGLHGMACIQAVALWRGEAARVVQSSAARSGVSMERGGRWLAMRGTPWAAGARPLIASIRKGSCVGVVH